MLKDGRADERTEFRAINRDKQIHFSQDKKILMSRNKPIYSYLVNQFTLLLRFNVLVFTTLARPTFCESL